MALLSCNSNTENTSPSATTTNTPSTKDSIYFFDKTTTFQDFISCFKDSLTNIQLSLKNVKNLEDFALSDTLVNDWIIHDTYAVTGSSLREEKDCWIPIGKHINDTVTTVCVVQLCKSSSAYLFQFNTKRNHLMYMHQIGYLSDFDYIDASNKEGEKYSFNISECESIHLTIRNNKVHTSCERYTATVGKDWRVDQNLYVNDTVWLPIFESSYSLY
ncbi:hypothetical protein [Parvicella tangerina]|uniref:hypothetical protein n=1 Tax=Parvicella tangerina TaxID=2829795 RepID=UPI00215D1948|nr:hypothetical protein [Parvicella tangerina]